MLADRVRMASRYGYGHSSGVPFSIQLMEESLENLSALKDARYGDGAGFVKYKINDGGLHGNHR